MVYSTCSRTLVRKAKAMTLPLGTPVVCPVMISRTLPFDTLHQLVAAAQRGCAQTILISDAAGIGKSRLVREVTVFVSARGFLVLQGHCFQHEYAWPYTPLLDLLRAYFALQRPVRMEFLDAIYALTEDNPCFVEETLSTLVAAGDIFYSHSEWDRKPLSNLRIPRTVQAAVQQRPRVEGTPLVMGRGAGLRISARYGA